jgi:hypothetical protein
MAFFIVTTVKISNLPQHYNSLFELPSSSGPFTIHSQGFTEHQFIEEHFFIIVLASG